MKTHFNFKKAAIGAMMLLTSLILSHTSYAQYGTMNISVANCSSTTNTLTFDVVIQNTNSVADTLNDFQFGLNFNYAGMVNGGTITFAYDSASQLNSNQNFYGGCVLFNLTSDELRLTSACTDITRENLGTVLPVGTNVSLGTFTLTNTAVWPNNVTPNFAFNTLTSTTTITQTQVNVYAAGVPGPATLTYAYCNTTLNPCVTPSAPTLGVAVAPSCSTPTGSVALNGLPSTGTWTVNPSGGTPPSFSGTGTSTEATGLTPSTTYTFTVSIGCVSGGPLTSASSPTSLTVGPLKVVPDSVSVGAITQPTCTTPTGTVALSGIISSEAWTITASPGGSTITGTSGTSSANFSGLTPDKTYTFQVKDADGCTPIASSRSAVVDTIPNAPTAPTAGTPTQPSCGTTTGSVTLTGLPSSGNWTVNSNTGGYTQQSSGTSTTFPTLAASTTYTFEVTDYNGCVSLASNNAVINNAKVTPTPPVVGNVTQQPSCGTPTGSVAFSVMPSAGAWTVTASPGGSSKNGLGAIDTLSGFTAGNTYTFTVTNSDGCTSGSSSGNAVINSAPTPVSTPTVNPINPPTCTTNTGNVAITGLPSTENWTVNSNKGGFTSSGNAGAAADTIFGALADSTYTFTVTNTDGCSATSGNAFIPAQPATPNPPSGSVTQPSCTAAGSVQFTNLPSGSWTLTATPGGATESSSGANFSFGGLSANTTYTFTVNSGGCTSAPSGNEVIGAGPATIRTPVIHSPSGITPPTCTSDTGSVALDSLPSSGTWTLNIIGGSGGLRSSTGASYTVSNLAGANTYNFAVTNSAGCVSDTSANAVMPAELVAPGIPTIEGNSIIPATCTNNKGSVVLYNMPSSGNYTISILPTATSTGTGASCSCDTVKSLTAGVTYTFKVTNSAGCSSPGFSTGAAVPTAPTQATVPSCSITQPGCGSSLGSAAFGSLPSPGAWTITPSIGGSPQSPIDGSGLTYTDPNLTPSTTYIFTVTNSSGCTASTGNEVVNAYSSNSVTAPIAGTPTQPNCNNNYGSVTLTGLPGTGAWTVTAYPGGATQSGMNVDSTIFTPLSPSTTYKFTVTNGTCTSADSSSAVVITSASAGTAAAPTAGTVTPPNCTTTTGSVTLTESPTITGVWTITATNTVSSTQATKTGTSLTTTLFGGLYADSTYNFTVTNSTGCPSPPSAVSKTIPVGPVPAATPTLGTVTQPTCAHDSGKAVLNGLPATGTWTLTPYIGSTAQNGLALIGTGTSATITDLIANNAFTFHVTDSSLCTSVTATASTGSLTKADSLALPTVLASNGVTQPTCLVGTGKIVFTAQSGAQYSIDSVGGADSYQTSATFPIVYPQTYTLKVRKTTDFTCVSISDSIPVIVNGDPNPPPTPTIQIVDSATCGNPFGTIAVNNPDTTDYAYFFNVGSTEGTVANPAADNGVFNNKGGGTYSVRLQNKNGSGCYSANSNSVVMNSIPGTPNITVTTGNTLPTYLCSSVPNGAKVTLTSKTAGGVALSATWSWPAPTVSGGTVTGGISGTATGSSLSFSQTLVNTGTTTALVTYNITAIAAGSSCSTPYSVGINVYPKANGAAVPSTQTICSATRVGIQLQQGAQPNTTFTWTYTSGSTTFITGPPTTCTDPTHSGACGTAIPDSVYNTGSTNYSLTYTITPWADGCAGTAFTSVVAIRPIPHITSITGADSVCSNGKTALIPVMIPSGGFVNATYAHIYGSAVTPASGSISAVTSLGQTFINTSAIAGYVLYTITPYIISSGTTKCYGPVYTGAKDTMKVEPNVTGTVAPASETIKESHRMDAILTPGPVAGTDFTWSTSVNSFIHGSSACPSGCAGPVTDSLFNTGTTNQTIIYYITPTANGCLGTKVSHDVTVYGTPQITGGAVSVIACSGAKKNINLTSSISGTTWTWSGVIYRNSNSSNGITGTSLSGTGSPLSQTLNNAGGATTAAVIVYAVTPSYGGVNGTTVYDTITLEPLPVPNVSPNPAPGCTGHAVDITLGAGSVPGTTYTWTAGASATISGATSCSGNCPGTITDVLTGTAILAKQTYDIVPQANGCAGAVYAEIVDVEIDYTNTPTISGQTYGICPGVVYYYTVTNSEPFYTVTWTLPTGCVPDSTDGFTLNSTPTIGVIFPSNYIAGFTPTQSIMASMTDYCGGYHSAQGSIKPTPTGGFNITGNRSGLCGGAAQKFYVTNFPNLSYSWSTVPPNNPNITIVSGNTDTLFATFSSSFVSGTIECSISGCGNGSNPQAFTAALAGKPIVSFSPPSGGVGSGCEVAVTAIGFSSSTPTWQWTVPSGPGIDSSSNTEKTYFIGGIGNSTLTVEESNSCGFTTASATVDWNGSECNPPQRSEDLNSASSFNVTAYPNPAHDKLNVVFNSNSISNYVVRLIDITGRTVMNTVNVAQQGTNVLELNLANYAKGIYSLSVATDDGSKQIRVTIE